MIISCSRRTDIPAYFSRWFIERIREGSCTVPNPFNSKQISIIDLRPEAVDAFVFWTRNPAPFMKTLKTIDDLGYKYYFLYTLNNYPRQFEPYKPTLESSIRTFRKLSSVIGKGRVIWRYDPIFLGGCVTEEFHLNNFEILCKNLADFTKRVIVSIISPYKKTVRRMKESGLILENNPNIFQEYENLLKNLFEIASSYNLSMESCASPLDLTHIGIKPARCIDDRILRDEFCLEINYQKDKNQRKECNCMVSKDIGMNNTCLSGCGYCYATISQGAARGKYIGNKYDLFYYG